MSRKPEKSSSLEKHLEEIASLEPADQASKLCWLIERVDITRGKPSQQVATTDILLEATMRICREQGSRLLGIHLPISKVDERILHNFLKALNMLDGFYATGFGKLTDRSRERKPDDRNYVGRCLAGRAMCAREVLLLSAAAHLNWPVGVWTSLHTTWRHSRKLELGDYVSAISRDQLTTEQVYICCVVLGLSDPYRLPFRGVHDMHKVIVRMLGGIKICELKQDTRERMMFLMKLKDDVPGIPLHNVNIENMNGKRFVIDVTSFVTSMEKLREEQHNSERAAETTEHLSDAERDRAIYAHLRLNLGVRPTRITDRIPDNQRYRFYTGFKRVRALASGKVDQSDEDERIGTPGTAYGVDRSRNGMKLQLIDNLSYKIRAGDVIAIKTDVDDTDEYRVGFVRWVRGGGASELEFGIELLDGHAIAATMSMLEEDDPSMEFDVVRCIAVVDNYDSPEKAVILASRDYDYIRQLRQIWIQDHVRACSEHKSLPASGTVTAMDIKLDPLSHGAQKISHK